MYVGLMFLLWWSDISPTSVCGVSVFAYCDSDISPPNVSGILAFAYCSEVILALPVYVVV